MCEGSSGKIKIGLSAEKKRPSKRLNWQEGLGHCWQQSSLQRNIVMDQGAQLILYLIRYSSPSIEALRNAQRHFSKTISILSIQNLS